MAQAKANLFRLGLFLGSIIDAASSTAIFLLKKMMQFFEKNSDHI